MSGEIEIGYARGQASPELVSQLRDTILRNRISSGLIGGLAAADDLIDDLLPIGGLAAADDLIDDLLPVIASVDANAHARGMAEVTAAIEDVDPGTRTGRDYPAIRGVIVDEIAIRCGQIPDVHPRLLEGIEAAAARLTHEDDVVDTEILPEWLGYVERAHGATFGPAVIALAQLLREADDTPPALRAMVDGFLQRPVSDRPHARTSDPSTSKAAEERVRPTIRRSGSQAHKILAAYATVADSGYYVASAEFTESELVYALTSREVEEGFNVREAHKRTSDLLADGLLEVVRVTYPRNEDGSLDGIDGPLERDGGRVLRITDTGRTELARLDANAARRA